jgi:acyl-CoA synthetase (AMP-forming)/AMP-acid ligase II
MAEDWNRPGTANVAGALAWQAGRQPDVAAIHYPEGLQGGRVQYRSASYRDLDDLSDDYARGLLDYGIGRGTRTALMVPPGLDFFALFFALFKAGAVPVLIDPGIGLKPLRQCLREAAPEAFIGVPRAHLARMLLRWAPASIRRLVTAGPRLGWGGLDTRQLRAMGRRSSGAVLAPTRPDELAAILFTSGSTGIPKGVVYRHRHFVAQVEMLGSAFGIQPGEVDLPTFPPFALFDPALGMTTVVPSMDPTRPARADPARLVQAIREFGVSNVFGSPALVRVLGEYAAARQLQLGSVKRVISAGAAVPIEVIRTMQRALPGEARIFTPYGATECLPVAAISSAEIDPDVERRTLAGDGICVGRPVPPNRVAVMPIRDGVEDRLDEAALLPTGAIGEIIVHGPTTTDAYWQRDRQTRLAKTTDARGRLWHRMGDAGYFDAHGRLWYCGRKSQRIEVDGETLFPDQLEALFNPHPDVLRTALVGVSGGAGCAAVLCVELRGRRGRRQRERIRADLLQMAQATPRTRRIRHVLFHHGFPVDIRHNAKIGRERLAAWAAGRLS